MEKLVDFVIDELRDDEQCSGFVCHCCRVTSCFVSADHPVNSPEAYESRVQFNWKKLTLLSSGFLIFYCKFFKGLLC